MESCERNALIRSGQSKVYYANLLDRILHNYTIYDPWEDRSWKSCLYVSDLMGHTPPPSKYLAFPWVAIRYALFKIGFPFASKPFLPFSLIRDVPKLVAGKRVLELGSGHSTIFFARYASSVVSCETDPGFFGYLAPKIRSGNVRLQLCPTRALVERFIDENQAAADIVVVDNYQAVMPRYDVISRLCAQGIRGKTIILDNADNPQNYRCRDILGPPSKVYVDYGNMSIVVSQSMMWVR